MTSIRENHLRSLLASDSYRQTSKLRRFIACLRQMLTDIFLHSFCTDKPNSMCKYYGHVIDHKQWRSGQLPRCVDCGTSISSASELRGASIKKK